MDLAVVNGLLSIIDTSMDELQKKIAEVNISDLKAQTKKQDYSREIVSITNRFSDELGENRWRI